MLVTTNASWLTRGVNANQKKMRFNHYEKLFVMSIQIVTTDKGIRVWDKTVTTYEQMKIGLTSIYIKRKVQSDGFYNTKLMPLDDLIISHRLCTI